MKSPFYSLYQRARSSLFLAAMVVTIGVPSAFAEEVALKELFKSPVGVSGTVIQTFDSSKSVTGNLDYKALMTRCRGYDNVGCDNLVVFGVVNKTDAPESQRAMNKMTIISPSGRRRIENVDISGGSLKYDKSKVLDNEIAIVNVGFYKGMNKTPFQRCDTDFVFCGSKVVGCPTNTDSASCSPTVASNVQVNMNCICTQPNQKLMSCINNTAVCADFVGGPSCKTGEVGVGDKCQKTWSCSNLPAGAPNLADTCQGSAVTIGPVAGYFPATLTCTGSKSCPGGNNGNPNEDPNPNPSPSSSNVACKAGEVADGKVCKTAWTCGTLNSSELGRLAQVCTTSSESFSRSAATYYPTSLSCPGSKACGESPQDPGCKDERTDTVVKALFCVGEDAKDNCSKARGSGSKNCTNCAATTKSNQNGSLQISLPEAKDQTFYSYYVAGNFAATNTGAQGKQCGQPYSCKGTGFTSDSRPAQEYSLIQYKCLGGEWAERSRYAYAACNCTSYNTATWCGTDDITRLTADGGICLGSSRGNGFFGAKGKTFKQGEGLVGYENGETLLDPASLDER